MLRKGSCALIVFVIELFICSNETGSVLTKTRRIRLKLAYSYRGVQYFKVSVTHS